MKGIGRESRSNGRNNARGGDGRKRKRKREGKKISAELARVFSKKQAHPKTIATLYPPRLRDRLARPAKEKCRSRFRGERRTRKKKRASDCSLTRPFPNSVSPKLLHSPRASGAPRALRQQGHSPRRCCWCRRRCSRRRSATRRTETKTKRRRRCSQPSSSPPRRTRTTTTRSRRRGRALRGCAAFGVAAVKEGAEKKEAKKGTERRGRFLSVLREKE